MAERDRAIGLLLDDATGEELGTAFAVPGGHALTALHVVGDRDDYESPVRHPELVLQFPSGPVFATVKAWDNDLDVALLALDRLPSGVELHRLQAAGLGPGRHRNRPGVRDSAEGPLIPG